MTPTEKAYHILGSQTDATRKQVARVAAQVGRLKNAKQSGRHGTLTKAQKTAAGQVAAALKRLENALKNSADDIRLGFPLDKIDFERWHTRAKAASNKELCKQNPPDQAKLYAARNAAQLLIAHGRPLPLTRKGPFCQLAAILFGRQGEDFLHHCRAVVMDLKRSLDRPG